MDGVDPAVAGGGGGEQEERRQRGRRGVGGGGDSGEGESRDGERTEGKREGVRVCDLGRGLLQKRSAGFFYKNDRILECFSSFC